MFFIKTIKLMTGLLLLTVAVSSAHAYSYRTCSGNKIKWNSGWTNMYISTTSFPAGSVWDSRLQNAMWHWNNVKGAGFNFYVGRDTDGTHNSSNGRNEVYFTGLAGGTLAVTLKRYHCYWFFGWRYGIDETDIGFNSSLSWTPWTLNPNNLGSPYNLEGVALHELGHALGLNHEDRWMATLNSYYPTSGPLGYYQEWDPHADDRQGVRFLYPDGTTETDIAGSVFRRTGSGSSGLVTSPITATRGSYVTIQWTFGNQSTSTRSFNTGFYLSTNSYISIYDRLLGTNYGAWGSPGYTGTFSRTLYIPTSVTPGTYYLGYLVDNNFAIAEAVESNNYVAIPRLITIQ